MTGDRRNQPVGTNIFMEIQRFLADEAALLDRLAFFEVMRHQVAVDAGPHLHLLR